MGELSKYKWDIVIGIICLVTGFIIGRGQTVIKETHTIEWKTQDPIKIDVPYPFPVKEIHTTINEKLVPGEIIRDTVFVVDTPQVVKDYLIERSYSQTFFNNKEQGKLTVNSTVQYNKQKNIGIDYQPVIKIERLTKVIEPTWTPFVSAGWRSDDYVTIGAGIFYHDIGFEYNYNQNIGISPGETINAHEFKIKYKF